MLVVVVQIHIKPDFIESFIAATIENARNSLNEPGITRFDFLQQEDDPTRFILYETYQQPEDQASHRETPHYQIWKDAVAGMMAEPRVGIKHRTIYPGT